MNTYQQLIGNEWCDPASGAWIDSVEPFSGDVWARVPRGNAADAERAVQAAHQAFNAPAWANLSATERGALLRKLAGLIERDAEKLGAIEQRSNGKLIVEVAGQMRHAAQWVYYYAGLADKVMGNVVPMPKPGIINFTRLEPLGVVLAITPWNSPFALTIWKLAPALAAGNTMVIKPSEFTSASLFELGKLCLEAGFPPGVVNVVSGYGAEIGEPLANHPLVAKIAFTGGEIGGKHVNMAAAQNFKHVTLELGGKSANIVLDDADIDQAVKGAIAGIFSAAGQTCMAGSRLLLQDTIHDQFVEKLVAEVKKAKIGDPSDRETQIGPIATKPHFEKVLSYIEIAKNEGATCVLGGHSLSGPGYGQGQFVAPTIFTNVKNSMRIAQEEVFGPVLSVIRFSTVDEALDIANDTNYGLAGAVWTKDLHRAFYCIERIRAGTVWVNNYRATSFATPFGGYKRSGIGREGGAEAIKEYLQTKSVWITTQPNRANPFVLG
jgi:acyl-CoA reductase-like NAD-dependent aldehyde dehydrogenase